MDTPTHNSSLTAILLQGKGDPISDRAWRFEIVPAAFARLEKAMETNSLMSQTTEPKFAHISPEVCVFVYVFISVLKLSGGGEGQETTTQRFQRRPPMLESHVRDWSRVAPAFSSAGMQITTAAPLAPPRSRQSYGPKISPQLTRPQPAPLHSYPLHLQERAGVAAEWLGRESG